MKEKFDEALHGKNIPILTIDNKWYKLLDEETRKELSDTEEQLNALLRRQGKLNTDLKEIKKLKKTVMKEIVSMADEVHGNEEKSGNDKQMEKHKSLLQECNEKIDQYQDELLDLPREIEQLNLQLMSATMEHCYSRMHENEQEIDEISEWIKFIRIELKKKIVKKQEMEQENQMIYSYMHDIFGAEIVDLFDLKYKENP